MTVAVVTLEIEHHDEENTFHTTYKVHRYIHFRNTLANAFRSQLGSEGIRQTVVINPGPPRGYVEYQNVKNWFVHPRNSTKRVRYPRLGSFEVTLRLPANFAPGAPEKLLVWSKLNTKRWPPVEGLTRDIARLLVAAQQNEDVSDLLRKFKGCSDKPDEANDTMLSTQLSLSRQPANPPMFFALTPRGRVPTPVEIRGPGRDRQSSQGRGLSPALQRPSSANASSRPPRPNSATRTRPQSASATLSVAHRQTWENENYLHEDLLGDAGKDDRGQKAGETRAETNYLEQTPWSESHVWNVKDSEVWSPLPAAKQMDPVPSPGPPVAQAPLPAPEKAPSSFAPPAVAASAAVTVVSLPQAELAVRSPPLPPPSGPSTPAHEVRDGGGDSDYGDEEFEDQSPAAAPQRPPKPTPITPVAVPAPVAPIAAPSPPIPAPAPPAAPAETIAEPMPTSEGASQYDDEEFEDQSPVAASKHPPALAPIAPDAVPAPIAPVAQQVPTPLAPPAVAPVPPAAPTLSPPAAPASAEKQDSSADGYDEGFEEDFEEAPPVPLPPAPAMKPQPPTTAGDDNDEVYEEDDFEPTMDDIVIGAPEQPAPELVERIAAGGAEYDYAEDNELEDCVEMAADSDLPEYDYAEDHDDYSDGSFED